MWRTYKGVIHCVFDQIPNLQNCFTNQNLGEEEAQTAKHLPPSTFTGQFVRKAVIKDWSLIVIWFMPGRICPIAACAVPGGVLPHTAAFAAPKRVTCLSKRAIVLHIDVSFYKSLFRTSVHELFCRTCMLQESVLHLYRSVFKSYWTVLGRLCLLEPLLHLWTK